MHVPKRVIKDIARIPKHNQARIMDALRDFEIDPWLGDVAKLASESNLWRRRVGSYRILYSLYFDHKLVEVKHVARRTSATY